MRMVDGSAVRAGGKSSGLEVLGMPVPVHLREGAAFQQPPSRGATTEIGVPARTVTLTSAQPKSAHQLSLAEAGR
jgi:hypothetical protein